MDRLGERDWHVLLTRLLRSFAARASAMWPHGDDIGAAKSECDRAGAGRGAREGGDTARVRVGGRVAQQHTKERRNGGQMNTRERNSEAPKDRNRRNALLFLALRTTTTTTPTTIPTNQSIRSLSLARSLALSLCVPLILGDHHPRHLIISCNGSRVVSWCSWVRVLRRHRW